MKMRPECVPCLIGRVLFETMEVEPSLSHRTVKAATEALGRLFDEGVCSASVATEVHEGIYRMLGTADPYAELKRRSNEVALGLYPRAERFVESSDDRLRAAFLSAVVGNVLDFGIGSGFDDPEKLEKEFQNLLDEGLGHDDTDDVRRLLEGAGHVFYLTDNCGEVVFDRLALKELKATGVRVTLVVKGEPILTDATTADIEDLGMDGIVDEVIETPGFAVGIGMDALRGAFGDKLREADLIVAKGMANYEALSETDIGPVVYLLRTKCDPVADSLGLPKGINAVKLLMDGGTG